MKDKQPPRMDLDGGEMTCLRCGRSAFSRGLCDACYRSAARLVRIGKVTWDELERKGKVLHPQKQRGAAAGWLLKDK